MPLQRHVGRASGGKLEIASSTGPEVRVASDLSAISATVVIIMKGLLLLLLASFLPTDRRTVPGLPLDQFEFPALLCGVLLEEEEYRQTPTRESYIKIKE